MKLSFKKSLCLLLASGMILSSSANVNAAQINMANLPTTTLPTIQSNLFNPQVIPNSNQQSIHKILRKAENENAAATSSAISTPSAIATPQAITNESINDSIQQLANLYVSYGVMSSMQYAVMQDGKLLFQSSAGYADTAKKVAPTENTMYGIASISKMFVTTAIMQLVDQGKIDLDTPVVKYLPTFKMKDARYKKITVRMLLNHSSGLNGDYASIDDSLGTPNTTFHDNLLKTLSTQTLKADPGAFSVYCNDGFALAELVVEKVSGLSFTNYVQKNIADKLALENTKSPLANFDKTKLAKIYKTGVKNALPTEFLNSLGAGGLFSTSSDLCKFGQAFTHSADSLLSQNSILAMENKECNNGLWVDESGNFMEYGLGWDSVNTYPFNEYGIKAVHKSGDLHFTHGDLLVLPDQNISVAVTMTGDLASSLLSNLFAQSIAKQLLLKDQLIEDKPLVTAYTVKQADVPEEIKSYSGTYCSYAGNFTIKFSKNSMTLTNLSTKTAAKLTYSEDGKFIDDSNTTAYSFKKESNGNIYLMSDMYAENPDLGAIRLNQYQAQKTGNSKISSKTQKAWLNRNGKIYFLTGQTYNAYPWMIMPYYDMDYTKKDNAYFGNNIITSKNTAVPWTQIPYLNGRCSFPMTFSTKNGVESLNYSDCTFKEIKKVASLPTKKSFSVKSNGKETWFKITSKNYNKQLTVKTPAKSTYCVYDKKGICINDSYIYNAKTSKLPKGGYVVFIGGKKGSSFKATLK